jgi:hypothetical protein
VFQPRVPVFFLIVSPSSCFLLCCLRALLGTSRLRQLSRSGAVFTVSPGTITAHGLGRLHPCLPYYPHVSLFHLPCAGGRQATAEPCVRPPLASPSARSLNKSAIFQHNESRADTRCQVSTKGGLFRVTTRGFARTFCFHLRGTECFS